MYNVPYCTVSILQNTFNCDDLYPMHDKHYTMHATTFTSYGIVITLYLDYDQWYESLRAHIESQGNIKVSNITDVQTIMTQQRVVII